MSTTNRLTVVPTVTVLAVIKTRLTGVNHLRPKPLDPKPNTVHRDTIAHEPWACKLRTLNHRLQAPVSNALNPNHTS